MARCDEFKPYVWDFSRPSQANYHVTVGAQLPVIGKPAFGSDVTLPSALPKHTLNPPRSYAPTGKFWSRIRFSGDEKLWGLDSTDVVMRYDPEVEFSSMEMSASKRLTLTEALKLTLRDAYSFSTDRFDTEDVGWNTTKSVQLSLGPTQTTLGVAVSTSKNDDIWHSSLSLEQPLGKAIRLHAGVAELQSETRNSVFGARFSRNW